MKNAVAPCGDNVLKTDKSLGATQLCELSMALLKAKVSYCQFKSTFGLRSKLHQLEGRVDGSMLIPLPDGYGTLWAA
jgi:hypothetical protein